MKNNNSDPMLAMIVTAALAPWWPWIFWLGMLTGRFEPGDEIKRPFIIVK